MKPGVYIPGDGPALRLEKCRIDGSVNLSSTRVVGQIDLAGSHVRLLRAAGAVIEGSLLLRREFRADQGLRLLGIRVSNILSCSDSHITAPPDNAKLCAIEMFRAHVGDLFINRARIEGGIFARRVTVDQNIRLRGSVVKDRSAMGWKDESDYHGAGSFAGATVGGTLSISTSGQSAGTVLAGPLELSGMSCGTLAVQAETLAAVDIRLGHLAYRRLVDVTPAQLFSYIHRQDSFDTSAYTTLAQYCGAVGEFDLQRRILAAMERRTTRLLPRRSATRIRRLIFEYVVGYGYTPMRSLVWLAGSLAACTLLLRVGGSAFLVPRTAPGAAAAPAWGICVELALDNLLPFAALGVQAGWSVAAHGAIGWIGLAAFLVLKFGAWGLVALGLGSISGLIRNPS